MSQLDLIADESTQAHDSEPRRGGPPNRMNDLPYRDWMKFQKSFFRHETDEALSQIASPSSPRPPGQTAATPTPSSSAPPTSAKPPHTTNGK